MGCRAAVQSCSDSVRGDLRSSNLAKICATRYPAARGYGDALFSGNFGVRIIYKTTSSRRARRESE